MIKKKSQCITKERKKEKYKSNPGKLKCMTMKNDPSTEITLHYFFCIINHTNLTAPIEKKARDEDSC